MHDWPSDDVLRTLLAEHGSKAAVARHLQVSVTTLKDQLARRGIKHNRSRPLHVAPTAEDAFPDRVRDLIKRKKRISVEAIADELDCAPGRIRAALASLQDAGYRVPEQHGEVTLAPVEITKGKVHKSLLEGDEVTFGVVSDTHLASKECALEHLHLAYDHFHELGITEVLHAGDIVAGRGIYRTQDQDLTRFTFETQVDHAVAEYPQRGGIRTLLIGGNHDLEGDFGKLGADPCRAITNRRADIEYLGAYSGYVEMPNGAHVQLVHGRGGGSYAVSYKPQKYVEGLPPGRKPALIVFGHWHISGFFRHRNVGLLLGGAFEWQTSLLVRLGLAPDVGFWTVKLTLGDDGSVVKTRPEWHGFYEGRVVHAAVAA